MIDVNQEELIRPGDVPKCLPPRANGKRLHISAVYRWMLHGVRGHRLETATVGGATYTSIEALQRFSDCLTQGRTNTEPNLPRNSGTRQRQIDGAAREVQRILRSCSGKPKTIKPNHG